MIKNLNILSGHSKSIHSYNLWFIKLRWFAAISLVAMLLLLQFLFNINLSDEQIIVFLLSASLIFLYNYFFLKFHRKITDENNPSLFSLIQILIDLSVLSILVYFSGGITSPLLLFYYFHMLIGTMILHRKLMFAIVTALTIFLILISFLEIQGLIDLPKFGTTITDDYGKVFYLPILLFSTSLYLVVYLTSKLVYDLYMREEQLNRALNEIRSAEEAKHHYTIALIHELKSPMAASISNVDLVIDNYLGEVSEPVKEKLVRVKKRLSEGISNINSILKFSQFKLLQNIELKELRINDVLIKVIESNRDTANKKEIKIEIYDSSNRKVKGDPFLLELLFSNLIGNAIKYGNQNGHVKISIEEVGKNTQIRILDDGIGIPEKDLPKIFEEYFRASNSDKIEGTGTGLSIVKKIIEAHSGKISVISPVNKFDLKRRGTEFTITIPIVE